ncbi:MAG: hypothetical protein QOJ90_2035 [Actinomycetota bacterium]|nr:hypothetical protein [Actinomycetota bacterium]
MARNGRPSPLRTTPTLIALGGLLAALGSNLAGTGAAALGVPVAGETAIDGGGRGLAAPWGPDSRGTAVRPAAAGQPLGPVAGAVSRVPVTSVPGFATGPGLLPGTVQVNFGGGPVDIPARVLAAYRAAAVATSRVDPTCHLTWPLLAGIGRIESGHARGGAVDASGRTLTPILGPVLSGGSGFAAIRDTDNGRFDGDPVWDRAVGPMQFIPSSWARYGRDGNGDGRADPHNVDDAALASAAYLCAGDRDLRDTAQLRRAVFGYNNSWDYVATVLAWAGAYAGGGFVAVPSGGGGGGGGGGAVVLASGRGSSSAERRPAPSSRPPASVPPSPAPSSSTSTSVAPMPTATSVLSTSPTPSSSPTPSETSTPTTLLTGCPTDTATPTPTASEGSTPTPIPTPTVTSTADPSASPTPTGTDSAESCTTAPTPTVSSTSTTPSPRAVEGP